MPPSSNNQVVMIDNCYIMLNGSDLTSQEMSMLDSVEVDCTPEIPSMCVINFYDDGTTLINGSKFDVGVPLKVSFKPRSAQSKTVVFNGEIISIEPVFEGNSTFFKVTAFDKLHRLNKGTHSAVYAESSDSDIMTKLLKGAGLSAQVDTTTSKRVHVFQDNVSNLAFITYLAHRSQMWVKLNPVTEKVEIKKNAPGNSNITLLRGENLQLFRPRLSAAQQVSKVEVKSWDAKTKKPVVGVAQSSSAHPQVGYGKSGTQAVGTIHQPALLEYHPDARTQEQAVSAAQSRLDEMNSQFIVAEGTCYGDPAIQPNNTIEIRNLGAKFSGTYIITRAVHRYNAEEGYLCDFSVEGGAASTMGSLVMAVKTPAARVWPGVYPAIVTNNNDPDKMGRVKLKYPWLDEQMESNWARLTAADAGNQRGIMVFPEVNDEVLVAFEAGDFNFPYVVGALWNGQDAVPLHPVKNSKVTERLWKTRTGHELHFYEDDSTSKIVLKEKNGLQVILDGTGKKVTVQESGQNIIEIDGNGGKISLKASTAIEVTAPNIKLAGSAGIKIESSGMVEIKGSMVKVN